MIPAATASRIRLARRSASLLALCVLLPWYCPAQNTVISGPGNKTQEIAPQAPEPPRPDNRGAEVSDPGADAQKLKDFAEGLRAIGEKLKKAPAPPAPTPSPRPSSAVPDNDQSAPDWEGTWVGVLTCIDSPQGDEGRTALFVVRVCTEHWRATVQAGDTAPTRCSAAPAGSKLTLAGAVRGTSSGTMKVNAIMRHAGKNLASVTIRTINDRGITSGVAGEMERR